MTAKAKTVQWYNQRWGTALTSLVCLLLAFLLASRALDTGSLQQYFLTLVLLALGVNRAVKTIKR